ncbi:Lysine methyltransferase, putative [Angomonas deanei]|uniref:Lysine methyltransferase, putative n=1 Tax=Angomonas deanei TaxID=59799 RepID=A0A7G2CG76_9TRYP|nr:Lysine methyltransferase, putative [Angomonas deanei]
MSAHASNDVDGEEDPVHLELMESYIGLSVMNAGVNDDWCYKSFFNPYIERLRTTRRTEHKYLNMDGGVEDASGDKEERREQRRREKKEILSMFCPVRVSCQQLSNVGYSLWPASFVMTQLLAQELVGTTRLLAPYLFPHRKLWGEAEANEPPLDMSERLNIVELGSGVGLTPALLHRVPAYCRHVGTYTITDYQNGILENINYNLDENKVCRVEDYVAASRGLQSDVEPPFHMTAIVDWTRLATARSVITSCPMNLLLAADCIYDVDVIPGLVATMRVFMQESFPAMVSKSNRMTLGSTKQENDLQKRTCLVVQTHRQNSTMKVFFDAVREFAVVRSYLLVRRRIGEMRRRLSSGKDGRDRGLIPLGEWAATIDQGPTVFEDEERIVCALQPDEVLPDGSLRSLRGVRNVADTTGSTSHRGGSSTPRHGFYQLVFLQENLPRQR